MKPYDKVISLLPQLSPEEANKVMLSLKGLASVTPKRKEESTPVDDWLLNGILDELRRRGLLSGQISRKRIECLCSDFNGKLDRAKALLLTGVPKLSTPQYLALGRIAGGALANYLTPIAPLGPKLMLNNVDKVVEAFEASYPGYRECGLITVMLPKDTRGEDARKKGSSTTSSTRISPDRTSTG
jgi:hypothetical protein